MNDDECLVAAAIQLQLINFRRQKRDTENGTIPNFQPSSSVSAKSFEITEPLWSEELCNARFLKKPPR
jgi:hypothetical protein